MRIFNYLKMQNGELRVIGTNVARASRASEALRAVYGVSLARS